jgi:transcriptional regulator with XRE-family HTH domain
MEQPSSQAQWYEILKRERELYPLTQEEVAEKLEIDVRTVRNWEHGRRFPTPKYRRGLSDLYKKTLTELKLVEETPSSQVEHTPLELPESGSGEESVLEEGDESRYGEGITTEGIQHVRATDAPAIFPPLVRRLSSRTWKIIVFLGMAVLLGAGANIIATWFISSEGTTLADSPLKQLLAVWPIALPVGCSLLLLAILIWLLSRWPTREAVILSEQNRTRMLQRLQHTYGDLLTQSLQGAIWIELGLAQKPDAVLTAAHRLRRLPDQPERDLPPETSILQVYREAQGELLILGNPGAGKSTLLLSLAQQLVEQAQDDMAQSLPVILPLSSWAIKRQPLQDWSSKQIAEIYNVPRQVCEQWMQYGQILLLLDGLDEMEEETRPACIAAINAYHHEHMMPLVVCSRETDYAGASKRHHLALQGAVIVQPLTKEQVDRYLAQVGAPVAALRKALTSNPALQELATTPLMLNVLMLTYQGTSVRSLSTKGATLYRQVFDNYVQGMVERKGNTKLYPIESTRQWLGWLACQLREHNQTIFYPEHLQPDWLPAEQQRKYTWLAVRLPGVFIGMLAGLLTAPLLITFNTGLLLQYSVLSGFLGAVFSVPMLQSSAQDRQNPPLRESSRLNNGHLVTSALVGLIWGIVFMFNMSPTDTSNGWLLHCIYGSVSGLVIGLSCLLLLILFPRLAPKQILTIPRNTGQGWWSSLWHMTTLHGRRALLAATVFGVGIGLSYELSGEMSRGLNSGLGWGLSYGLLSVLISVILGTLTRDVHLTERLKWTRESLLRSLSTSKHLRNTLVFITISLVLFGLSQGLSWGLSQGLSWGLSQGLSWGVSWGLGSWFLFGLFQSISHEQVGDQDRRLFNQGIRDSLRNSALMSIIGAILIGIVSVLSWGLSYELSYGLNYGLSWGLSYELSYELGYGLRIGLSQGLVYAWLFALSGGLLVGAILSGGLAVLRHYVLRLLLWCAHTFPWRTQPLLEDMTARILLRRIGGGYSFTHRLLLDYFADLNTASPSRQLTWHRLPTGFK